MRIKVHTIDSLLTLPRNFLLFVPHGVPSLKAILTYYSATASVTHEGDVHVNDPLQGLGILSYFLQIFILSAVLGVVMPACILVC